MSPEMIIDLFREAIAITILLVSVLILPSLVVGLIVSIFQAATQINEQTLSFVPRLLATFLAFILAGPWLLHLMIDFSDRVIGEIPQVIN